MEIQENNRLILLFYASHGLFCLLTYISTANTTQILLFMIIIYHPIFRYHHLHIVHDTFLVVPSF